MSGPVLKYDPLDPDIKPLPVLETTKKIDHLDTEKIWSMSLHPSYPLLAIGCEPSTVKIWSMRAFQYIAFLPQVGVVKAVSFSSCTHFLAVAASDSSQDTYVISIYEIKPIPNSLNPTDFQFQLREVDSDLPDANEYEQYDVLDVFESGRAKLHQSAITCLAFQPPMFRLAEEQCQMVASGSADHTVRLWYFNMDRCKLPFRLTTRQHSGEVTGVAFSDRGTFMASTSACRQICIYNVPPSNAEKNTVESLQVVLLNLTDEVPHCVSFFPAEESMFNRKDGNINTAKFLVGTTKKSQDKPAEGFLYMYDALVTKVPDRTQLSELEDYRSFKEADDEQDLRGRKKQSKKTNAHVTHTGPKAFQALEDPNFLSVTLVQGLNSAIPGGGVKSVTCGFYEDLVGKDPGRFEFTAEHTHSCLVALTGSLEKARPSALSAKESFLVHAHTFVLSSNRNLVNRGRPAVVSEHEAPVTAVCLPTVELRHLLWKGRYLEAAQHFAISGSLDETVKITKFLMDRFAPDQHSEVDARTVMYLPRSLGDEKSEKYKPLVLERPLADAKAQELFTLKEELKEVKARQIELSDEERRQRKLLDESTQLSTTLDSFRMAAIRKAGKVAYAALSEAQQALLGGRKAQPVPQQKPVEKQKRLEGGKLKHFEALVNQKREQASKRACSCSVM